MPKISLKNPQEIKIMAEGGEKLGKVLSQVLEKAKPGMSTLQIDAWIEKGIAASGGIPAFKKVPHYHWASCIGINNEVVHSIPLKNKILKEKDLLKVDLGMLWKGFNTDLSWTVEVHEKKQKAENEKFLKAGERALQEAIKVAKAGNRIGHISETIQEIIEESGYSPVAVLTGHGIGRMLHEEPMIPGILKKPIQNTMELMPGMCLAIEVIYNQGGGEVVMENDGWTISTKDGRISGLFEKTIAITEEGPLVLTPVQVF